MKKATESNLPGGPEVTLMSGLLTVTILCCGPVAMLLGCFCTSVTVCWLFPALLVTMATVGLAELDMRLALAARVMFWKKNYCNFTKNK